MENKVNDGMLHSEHHYVGNTTKPTLVFLHGLLGNGDDWQSSIEQLTEYSCLTIDLPGHGQSAHITCTGFDDCCDMISNTVSALLAPNQPVVMIGYSMGGRVAMHGVANGLFSILNLQGLIVEGSHLGLESTAQKLARAVNDRGWANRFNNEPIEQVLIDWYQQGVFSSLNNEQKQIFQLKRNANLGPAIAQMLLATSLAEQEYLLTALKKQPIRMHYICGENDHKFSQIARTSGLSFNLVSGAGHNVHQESPHAFAQQIKNFTK
nr:2-succinyl-6-hydroxy-2,4-cyclohexadiene-1-carboxylate synthase [Vibrio genomosp. F10]